MRSADVPDHQEGLHERRDYRQVPPPPAGSPPYSLRHVMDGRAVAVGEAPSLIQQYSGPSY